MHITFITRSMWAGGAERVIAELCKYLVKKKIKCNIITYDDAEVLYDLPASVKIFPIGECSKKKYLDKIMRYKKIREKIKELKPDVVLSMPEDIGIFVIPALLGTKIPVIVSERNNPLVMPWKKETRLFRKIFYPLASGFVFQTKEAASFFSKKIQTKGIILKNPLDLERIPIAWEKKRKKIIVGVGRLDKQKNFPLLIKAFSKFHLENNDYKLIIYGEGHLRKNLESLASSILPKGSYHFPGRKNNILDLIKDAKMFILSSDYEGSPNVLIEAMAMGMPVISTDCPSGGSSELIKNGINGILVPVNDHEKMAAEMKKLEENEEFLISLSKEAYKIREMHKDYKILESWRKYLYEFKN